MTANRDESRRRFLKLSLAGAMAGAMGRVAWAGELVPLEATDPMAIALAYHADAATVDSASNPSYKEGNTCANCMQFKSSEGQATGACALFAGKAVNANAWCKTWIKK